MYADGDTVIVFFDASGTARDGKPYANTYSWFLDLRDGKIVKTFAFFDSVAFNELWERVKPYRIRQVSLIKADCVAASAGSDHANFPQLSQFSSTGGFFDA
jgi:hypothetical protein